MKLKQRSSTSRVSPMTTPTRPNRGKGIHLPLSLNPEKPILESLSPRNMSKRDKDQACIMLALSVMGLWIFCLGGFNFNSGKDGAKNVLMGALQVESEVQVGQVVDCYNTQEELVSSISIQIHLEESEVKGVSEDAQRINSIPEITVKSAGPHQVTAYDILSDDRPQSPTIRIIGDAILAVPLNWDSTGQWMGSFTLPAMDGTYQLRAQWFGCSKDGTAKYSNTVSFGVEGSKKWSSTSELVPLLSSYENPTWSDSNTLFPTVSSAWVSVDQIKGFPGLPEEEKTKTGPRQQYAWTELKPSSKKTNKWVTASSRGVSNETASMVDVSSMVQSTNQQFWLNTFKELSNYELVCWIGGNTANLLHANFLSMRSQLFSGQRPFKFHYYPMTNLKQPDETWDQETKERFRKCKHILVAIDDDSFMESRDGKPLSSYKYKKQVTTFLKHLVRAFPDPTFPIWLFTVALEPPHRAKYETKHCYKDFTLAHGSNAKVHNLQHPCNEVLFDIFRKKDTMFASKHAERVRLLDNTDLSMAGLFGVGVYDNRRKGGNKEGGTGTVMSHPRRQDILALIALRTYVIVGKQVEEWRAMGQIGLVDGLHHNNTVEPNFELVPYTWN